MAQVRSILVLAALLTAGFLTAATAQQPGRASKGKTAQTGESRAQSAAPKSGPKVSLGDSDGAPGGSVVVPIYFRASEVAEIGKLKVEITFVSRNLKYSSVKKGLAAESGNVDVRAELKEGKTEKGLETSTLFIEAAVPQGKPGQKGMPAGLLGYITFKVNESAGPANITLRTTGSAFELGSNKAVQAFQTADSQVDILASGSEPLYSCFFFNH